MEIKTLTMAGSVPGLCSYLPWRGQAQGEEAAASVSPSELFGVLLLFLLRGEEMGRVAKAAKKEKEKEGKNWNA